MTGDAITLQDANVPVTIILKMLMLEALLAKRNVRIDVSFGTASSVPKTVPCICGYLDKVLSVTEGERKYTYDYHIDGQIARADYGKGQSEDFAWDGLALIRRGDEQFVNEPHVGGGNPVLSSKGVAYFNDMLGTTVGAWDGRAAQRRKAKRRYSAAALTAFGESLSVSQPLNTSTSQQFFTGKPRVDGLGHAFLFRNYRAGLDKWQTADPLGYPDGWNQLAYCGNSVTRDIDVWGCITKIIDFDAEQQLWVVIPWFNNEWDGFGQLRKLTDEAMKAGKSLKDYVDEKLRQWKQDAVRTAAENSLRKALVQYFSSAQGGNYSEEIPSEWNNILTQYVNEGWTLVYGPCHMGISIDIDTDIVNAGVGALIVEGCTHHWQARFIKE